MRIGSAIVAILCLVALSGAGRGALGGTPGCCCTDVIRAGELAATDASDCCAPVGGSAAAVLAAPDDCPVGGAPCCRTPHPMAPVMIVLDRTPGPDRPTPPVADRARHAAAWPRATTQGGDRTAATSSSRLTYSAPDRQARLGLWLI